MDASTFEEDFEDLQQVLLDESTDEMVDDVDADGLTGLLRSYAAVPPRAAVLVDELMSSHLPASGDARDRIIAAVDEKLRARRTRVGFLETLLKASRVRASRTLGDVSETTGISEEKLSGWETGSRPFGDDDVDDLARWIVELESDEGEAVDALRRSYATMTVSTSGGYAGRRDPSVQSVDELVAAVQDRIGELRRQGIGA